MFNRGYNKASSRIKRRGKFKRNFFISIMFFLPFFLIASIFLLSRSNFLKVKNFNISGTQSLSTDKLKEFINTNISGNKFLFVPKSNIFFVNKENLSSVIMSQFPRIEGVVINKNIINRNVSVSIKERTTDFLWCSPKEECFFMDKNGLVFEPTLKNQDKIIFMGGISENPLLKSFASKEEMDKYIQIIDVLKKSDIHISIINFEYLEKVVFKTNVGDVILSLNDENLSDSVQNVLLLIQDSKSKNKNVTFQYIDARFGNKMFYKLK